MSNERVAETQALPVGFKDRSTCHHVNVVRAHALAVAFDEKGIPRRNVVAEAGAPEVVVILRLENRRNFDARSPEAGHLYEHVHDGFGSESGHRGAAEVLDAPDKSNRQATAKVLRLSPEQIGPVRVVWRDTDFLANGALYAILKGIHFTAAQQGRPRLKLT